MVNSTPAASAIFTAMENTVSIERISRLPQYCAISTAAPEVTPNSRRPIINCTCAPREAPESTFSPTLPSIITSIEEMPTLIRFWSAIGITRASVFL